MISYNPDRVRKQLSATMTEFEIVAAMELIEEIQSLKKEKNALVLGHNYMTPEVFYGTSDVIGDSLGLARNAVGLDVDRIVFNGVHFMAETAKIMNPTAKVLIPDLEAGCSLAESITAQDVRDLKAQYPGVPVITYVNCTAEVKAETDICCTSSNAVKVVNSVDSDTVIFLPDAYLAKNVAKQTDKRIIIWEKVTCMVHEQYRASDVANIRRHFDDLAVISHPECDTSVTEVSDFAGSTSQMADYIRKTPQKNILLITECSMGDNLRSEFPEKHFVSTCHTCPHMKKITLEKVRDALLYDQHSVELSGDIIARARGAVERMIGIG